MPLIRSDASRIVYRRPVGARILKGLFSLCCFVLTIGLLIGMWPDGPGVRERLPAEAYGQMASLLLIALMGFGLAAYLLISTGPIDLDLDLTTHTYRFRRGLPLLARRVSGPFDDIACLYVREMPGRAFPNYLTTLGWKNGGAAPRHDVALASHSSLEAAQAQARALAWDMGVQVEEDPEAERPAHGRRQGHRFSRRLLMLSSGCLSCMCLAISLPRIYTQQTLSREGRATLGTIVRGPAGQSNRIRYIYRVSGKTYQGTDFVTTADYKALPPGSTVPVTYLPRYPLTSRIARSNTANQAYFTLFLGLGILLIGLLRLLLSK